MLKKKTIRAKALFEIMIFQLKLSFHLVITVEPEEIQIDQEETKS